MPEGASPPHVPLVYSAYELQRCTTTNSTSFIRNCSLWKEEVHHNHIYTILLNWEKSSIKCKCQWNRSNETLIPHAFRDLKNGLIHQFCAMKKVIRGLKTLDNWRLLSLVVQKTSTRRKMYRIRKFLNDTVNVNAILRGSPSGKDAGSYGNGSCNFSYCSNYIWIHRSILHHSYFFILFTNNLHFCFTYLVPQYLRIIKILWC